MPRPRGAPWRARRSRCAFNLDGITTEASRADGDFDGEGHTLPRRADSRRRCRSAPIAFRLGPTSPGASERGGRQGPADRAAGRLVQPRLHPRVGGRRRPARDADDRTARGAAVAVSRSTSRNGPGAIGQWNSRLRDDRMLREVFVPKRRGPVLDARRRSNRRWSPSGFRRRSRRPAPGCARAAGPPAADSPAPLPKVTGLENIRPGFVKRDTVALVATHRHAPAGRRARTSSATSSSMRLDLPTGATAVVLPANDRIRVFAVTAASEPTAPVRAAARSTRRIWDVASVNWIGTNFGS